MSLGPSFYILITLAAGALPIVIGAGSSFLKISIVLGMTKNALGLQQAPGGLIVVCLSLALSLFVMGPVIEATWARSQALDLKKISSGNIKISEIDLESILEPWRTFLARFAGKREMRALCDLDGVSCDSAESGPAKISLKILLPAFMLSELKASFKLGFTLLLPFLVVDMVVANVLVGLGMYMVSPALISLPIKIILFTAANGWLYLSAALVKSYGG